MDKTTHKPLKAFPYPVSARQAQTSALVQQHRHERILTSLRTVKKDLRVLAWGLSGAYFAVALSFAYHAATQGRLEAAIHGCHVLNDPKACATIHQATEARK